MRRIELKSLILTAALPLAIACGSDRPDIDTVKQDFNSPSGKTSDKQSVIAVNGSKNGSEAALAVAGNGNLFAGGGLTAVGKKRPLESIQPARLLLGHALMKRAQVTGISAQNLAEAQSASECANQFMSARGSGNDTSGSFDVTIDVGKCDANLSGSLSMSVSYEIIENTKIHYELEQTLDNVCEKSGQMACVDGSLFMEMDLDFGSLAGGAGGGGLSYISAWALKATWKEDGKDRSASTKGGIRLAATDSQADLEYLFYVKDSGGNEVSLVLTFTANAEMATLKIRGADGEITCTALADNSGSCSGSGGTLEWTSDEYSTLADGGFGLDD